MKWIAALFCLLILIAIPVYLIQPGTIDMGKDNPDSLIGTKSSNYSLYGFQLGQTHEQAWEILENHSLLIGEKEEANPSRIYVYKRNADGSKGKSVLYLIWEPEERKMRKITVFQDCRNALSQSFRRLLTFEAMNDNAEFKGKFIGEASWSKVTLDIPSIELKITTYGYDEIGLEVILKQDSDADKVVFALVHPKP